MQFALIDECRRIELPRVVERPARVRLVDTEKTDAGLEAMDVPEEGTRLASHGRPANLSMVAMRKGGQAAIGRLVHCQNGQSASKRQIALCIATRTILWIALAILFLQCGQTAVAQNVRVFEWHRGQSTIALLFLHGLGGCAVPDGQSATAWCGNGTENSFRNSTTGKTWPDIVASDGHAIASAALARVLPAPLKMSDFGIWGVDYSRLTTSPCPSFSIPEVARAVRVQVEAQHIFDRYEQVIIVSHSMGGLVTKNMMLEWQIAGDPDGMLAHTIGVFLLGVPSQGSPLAPDPGTKRYILETLGIQRVANVCGRQVKDIYAGDENTYLFDLERRWENLLGARRTASQSQMPLIYCAYETVPEPILRGINLTIVQQLYTQTQCSQAAFPVGASHTGLPKPASAADDVHNAWLGRSLDNLFQQWASWGFARFEFQLGDSFRTLAQRVNGVQQAFKLSVDEIDTIPPPKGLFEAPNNYALVSKIVSAAGGTICIEGSWPAASEGVLILRPAGRCRT
jgi:hypothetical protein